LQACNGLLTKQVSARLRISEFTVRSYLKTIYCKLGVRSRGAMVYAYARSLSRVSAEASPHVIPN
jgi:DNA-binding NarL/FixJ family response regulator